MKLPLVAALAASAAAAADFTGTWVGAAKFDSGAQRGVCISLFHGTGMSGQVTFDDAGDAASITAGHGDGPTIEFSTADSRFELQGTERDLKGSVEFRGQNGSVSLRSFMPNGRNNGFGPPGQGPIPLSHPDRPEYSPEALAAELEGEVTLSLDVEPSGAVAPQVRVVKGLGKGLDEKAIECALKWTFAPPRMDCKAVRTPVQIQISFRLPPKR